ncbi:hypothetical protein [Streptomyces rishiriensis]|uniref:Uncharacterized protein n=1 Tax=Streptomyces rishiriensis TaxID=68264 RepID=A0ABU0NPT0_STRRH|nr:hypothetical protein [Streptomyces rishiriensis]MDQ0581126.1 hypothetical protein [Streptomyces rishiriensis]
MTTDRACAAPRSRGTERAPGATGTPTTEKFGATTELKAPPAAQTGDLTEAIKDAGAAQ